jgi:hypothetical protein
LLVSRDEFQEHGAVNGKVTAGPNTDKSNHDTLESALFLADLCEGHTKETKLGMAPARIPKIPERRSVLFQAIRRLLVSCILGQKKDVVTYPTISHDIPQKVAPKIRPQ